MSTRFDQSTAPSVASRYGKVVMTMSPVQAKLLAASIWLADLGDADHLALLDTRAEMWCGAASLRASSTRTSSSTSSTAAFEDALQRGSELEMEAVRSLKATAMEAATIAERAVLVAADTAKAAALGAQQVRAAATTTTASVMAETVRHQALAVQDRADAEAREVAAAETLTAVGLINL